LRRARSNLARARANRQIPEVLYEDLCFDAQQAAEKALKALLLSRSAQIPRTHDIAVLLTFPQEGGMQIPETLRESDRLTAYAVDSRYPGLSEDVSVEEYEQAVALAERVVRWVESIIPEVS